MSINQKEEFASIINDILKNKKVKEMDSELHHGITRYGHSIRVAKATYKCAKKLRLDYVSATRAAMLHDFYLDSDFDKSIETKEKLKTHAEVAVENAKKYFNISEKEANIIGSHMFPLGNIKPKYKESWLVTSMDKSVAIYEGYRFQFALLISIWTIFIFNMIAIQR